MSYQELKVRENSKRVSTTYFSLMTNMYWLVCVSLGVVAYVLSRLSVW